MTYDSVLLFSKTWGALYIALFFFAVLLWTFWPSHKKEMDEHAKIPLREGDKPCR